MRTFECVYSAMEDRLAPSESAYAVRMCIRTFSRLKYRRSIFRITVIFVNNYSNFANFCITIGPFDRAMLHLSGKNLNSFSSKIALRHFCKSGDDMSRLTPEAGLQTPAAKSPNTCQIRFVHFPEIVWNLSIN